MGENSWLILAGIVIGFFIIGTDGGRRLLLLGLGVAFLITVYSVFVKTVACPRTDEECYEYVQRTLWGPCLASNGAALIRQDGAFFLTAPAGVDASATCFSVVGQ